MNKFLIKVKYTKQLENGTFKRVTEPYLLIANTFTDAEARIYEELGTIIRGEFIIQNIQRVQFDDIVNFENDLNVIYKVKISYESLNLDSEKVETVNLIYFVNAENLNDCTKVFKEYYSVISNEYKIKSIQETKIVDYFGLVI